MVMNFKKDVLTVENIKNYIRKQYGDKIQIKDYEDKNYCFDIIAAERNFFQYIEYKTRYFTKKYFYPDDILIELVQRTSVISSNINNRNINSIISSSSVLTAVGWFFKTKADRLIYFRQLENKPYDLIDINFPDFKDWLMNHIAKYKLQFSNKTTGTINVVVPVKDIPKPIIYIKKY